MILPWSAYSRPNQTILPCTFLGYACWPNLRPYNTKKLEFCSKQCVFICYSPMHKGFKCLDIPIGRVYILRDVIFDKNVFPSTNLHSNAGAQLQSKILLLPPALLNLSVSYQRGEIIVDHMIDVSNHDENNSYQNCVHNPA
jgi:hypothetical protein